MNTSQGIELIRRCSWRKEGTSHRRKTVKPRHDSDINKTISVMIAMISVLSIASIGILQNTHAQEQTCPDGSQPDDNGNCQPSIHDQICNALQVQNIAILVPLLVALHLITLGASSAAVLAAVAAYCG